VDRTGETRRRPEGDVVYVRRSFTPGQLKFPKTEASMRAVPLQARTLDALDRIEDGNGLPLLFVRAGISTFDLSR
jgi:hypothetical protein